MQARPVANRRLSRYTFVGFSAAGVVFAVAEMGTLIPLSGGIVRYSEAFVDPALSFANGWNLVYNGCKFSSTSLAGLCGPAFDHEGRRHTCYFYPG
jgi:amino acid permease